MLDRWNDEENRHWAIVGGVVVFVWGGFSHMVLLKAIGFSPLPNEAAVLESLTSASPDDGLYFFPGMDLGGDLTND